MAGLRKHVAHREAAAAGELELRGQRREAVLGGREGELLLGYALFAQAAQQVGPRLAVLA